MKKRNNWALEALQEKKAKEVEDEQKRFELEQSKREKLKQKLGVADVGSKWKNPKTNREESEAS